MSFTRLYFGEVCGASNNRINVSYNEASNIIVVEGCITDINCANQINKICVVPSGFMDDSNCQSIIDSFTDYGATATATVGSGTTLNTSVNKTTGIQFYKDYIYNRTMYLWYIGYEGIPDTCNYSNVRTISVGDSVPDKPATPTYTVTQSCDGVNLNNTVTITTPNDTDVWEYRVYRATSSGGAYSLVGSIDPSSPYTYTDSNITQQYWYKVQAYNPIWQQFGAVETVSPTTTPSNLTNELIYSSFPTLGFSATTDTYGCETEQKWYGKLASDPSYIYKDSGAEYSEYGLQPNTDYNYYSTYTILGEESDPSTVMTINIPVSLSGTPSMSGETVLSAQTITLEWTDPNVYEDKYEIWRKVSGGTYVLIDTITGKTYSDTTVTYDEVYYYKVRGVLQHWDDDIYSSYSTEIELNTYPFIGEPTGTTSSSITTTGATLSWVNVNSSGVTGNYIQIYTGDTWNTIDSVASGDTSYVLTGLVPITEYDYRICAYNPYYTECSETINFTTLDPTPFNLSATVDNNDSEITWEILDPPFGTGIRPEYRVLGDTTWLTKSNISNDATGYTFNDLLYDTTYEVRFVRIGSEYPSNSLTFTTDTFPVPTGLTVDQRWMTKIKVSWDNNYDYENLWIVIDGVSTSIPTGTTEYTFENLIPQTTYDVYVRAEIDSQYGNSNTLEANTASYPFPFCEVDNQYTVTGATCGNTDGVIEITNKLYMELYDFTLTDFSGNTYTFDTDYTSSTYGQSEALYGGWYLLKATVKTEYKNGMDSDSCSIYIGIENEDTSISVSTSNVKPIQCGPFDLQLGRVSWAFTSTGTTHSLYIYKDNEIYYEDLNFSGSTAVFKNVKGGVFRGVLVNDDDLCQTLIARFTVETIPISSIGGIRKLFVTPYNSDLNYINWKTTDEDFYLESEDTSFFFSTKIKAYYSTSGGTLTWYKIPTMGTMSLSQTLSKVRQGILLEDTLNVDVPKGMIERFDDFTLLLPNKWVYVLEDNMGQWWTGGYGVGATIEGYTKQTGERGAENKYAFQISAQSADKLLTAVDSEFAEDYIIGDVTAPAAPTISLGDCNNGQKLATMGRNGEQDTTIVYTTGTTTPTRSSTVYTAPVNIPNGFVNAMQYKVFNPLNSAIVTEEIDCPVLDSYWRFDTGSGTTAYDTSGDVDGTITAMLWVTGKNNYGLRPNDSSAKIDLGNNYDFEYTDLFTISFWIRQYTTFGFETAIMSNIGTDTSKGWEITLGADNSTVYFKMFSDTNNMILSTNPVIDGNWHLITVVSNGSGEGGNTSDYNRIYVDGVINYSGTTGAVTSTIKDTNNNLLIANFNHKNYPPPLDIDEVGIWNKDLTESEISDLYNNGNGVFY